MTAFAIIKQSDSIHVVTDGLVTGGYGIVSKAFTIPHMNAVVVSRGAQTVAPFFITETWLCRDLDELRERCGDIARHCLETNRDMMTGGPDHEPDFDIRIAGWSPTKGPIAFWVYGSNSVPGAEPFRVYDMPGNITFAPHNASIQSEVVAKILRARRSDEIRPDLAGPRIIEIIRRHAQSHSQSKHQVGGHALLTSIFKEHIEQHIVREWPEHLVTEGTDEASAA
ncbi:hypothetical protein BN961_02906 [Afipia felis]|uniref:Uncharacterized protein n=1 Tax=Afipia felis TaxID=1035 RepID=A0A090MQ18_AFIFE|nr:hypothetical protein [Afipia felis]CEG09480.1 hypothetical protein BN961_02906 [Afipia felis]